MAGDDDTIPFPVNPDHGPQETDEEGDFEPEGEEPEQRFEPGHVPLFCLPDKFNAAKVGISISVRRRSRHVYSLEKMVELVRKETGCGPQHARERVVKIIYSAERQHGADAPLFIDPIKPKDESRIIKPWQR